MSGDDRASDGAEGAPTARLVLDVGRDGEDRLAGTIRHADREPVGFDGVIEMVAAVEDLVDRAHGAGGDEFEQR